MIHKHLTNYEGSRMLFIADDEIGLGLYRATSADNLREHQMSLKKMSVQKEKNLYILNDAVIIRTTNKLGIRVDFLVTGQTYFECIELIANYAFDGQFYKEFYTAFEFLETKQFEEDDSKFY